jgi:Tfp pilus assembly protein PilV
MPRFDHVLLRRRLVSISRHCAGSSLIEVMIAVMILAMVALGTAEFFAKGRFWFDQEERKRVATFLGQQAIERTISMGYPQIVNWHESRKVGPVRYAVDVTVQPDTPAPDLKTVRSVVSWPIAPNVSRRVTLATLVMAQ